MGRFGFGVGCSAYAGGAMSSGSVAGSVLTIY